MPGPDPKSPANPSPSSLKFGTSGLRGLVVDLVGAPARAWTAAFLAHLAQSGEPGRRLLIGRDLRASSPGIAADCALAAQQAGWTVLDCGALPTPALALAALREGAAAVMVTGSHIPDDRNGLKFYRASGEITKADEEGIRRAQARGGADAAPEASPAGPEPAPFDALSGYRRRYRDAFGADALAGLTVGVYAHSSVGRDVLAEVLTDLGARAVSFGRSERFVAVDTEAHRPEDLALLRQAAADNDLFAIASADGDADRPLLADAQGRVVRGDLLGLLSARLLNSDAVVTPVTSSQAAERALGRVVRTRVGSPFVIAGMEDAVREGARSVLGFEANGGVLLATQSVVDGRTLDALPTRDALLPILAALVLAKRSGASLRALVEGLGAGHALADRLPDVSPEKSGALLARLGADPGFARSFLAEAGAPVSVSHTDGVRFVLADGATLHLRASGNAPELRCYVEAATPERASYLLDLGLVRADGAVHERGESAVNPLV